MDTKKRKILFSASLLAVTALLAGGAIWAFRLGYMHDIVGIVRSDISPLLFIVLMILLPLAGFPISVFLIIAGIKFGIFTTMVIWLSVLPVHTTIAYTVAKYLRPLLIKLLYHTMGYTIPAIPARSEAMFSFLFLAIPGIPYAAKNYLLPLAGVSFRYCVLMNCLIQSFMGLPFIVLGKSGADQDPTLFYLSLFSLAVLFFFLRWLKRKFSSS